MFCFRPRGTSDIIPVTQKTTNLFPSLRVHLFVAGLTCVSSARNCELSCKDTGRAAQPRPASAPRRLPLAPAAGNREGRALPRFSAPRTPRAAGAATVCPAGSPAVTHSMTPSYARHTEPPPRLRRRAPGEGAGARVQLSGGGRRTAPHERPATASASKSLGGGGFSSPFCGQNGPGPPAQRPARGSLSGTGTRSRPRTASACPVHRAPLTWRDASGSAS